MHQIILWFAVLMFLGGIMGGSGSTALIFGCFIAGFLSQLFEK